MTEPHAPLREVRRWMRVSTPVNKAASSGLRGRLPQIAGPLMIGPGLDARNRAHAAFHGPGFVRARGSLPGDVYRPCRHLRFARPRGGRARGAAPCRQR